MGIPHPPAIARGRTSLLHLAHHCLQHVLLVRSRSHFVQFSADCSMSRPAHIGPPHRISDGRSSRGRNHVSASDGNASGGIPEDRWEYNHAARTYSRWWAVMFFDLMIDGQHTRPIRWTLNDIVRVEIGGMVMYHESWSWAYLDDINYYT